VVPTTVPYCCQFLTGCLFLFFCSLKISWFIFALKDNTNQREEKELQCPAVQTVNLIPVIWKDRESIFH